MMVLVLVIGRWPTLIFPYALNPDESQFVAGAHTLSVDPIFWRSVNGMTSGPLNFFALWPASLIFGFGSYVGARVTALALIAIALFAAHHTLARRFGAEAARLGGFPTLCFLAFTAHPDFTHYSSELLSSAALSTAVMLAVGIVWGKNITSARFFIVGGLLGILPLSKPQFAPLGLAVGVALLVWLWRQNPVSRGMIGRLLAGAILPTALAAAVVYHYGMKDYVLSSYLEQNFSYVDAARSSWGETAFRLLARLDPTCPLYFGCAGTAFVGALLGLSWLRQPSKVDRDFLIGSACMLILAIVCVLTPRRAFPHYLMVAVVPWTLFFGGLMGNLLRSSPAPSYHRRIHLGVRSLIITTALILILIRAEMPYPPRPALTTYHSDFNGQVVAMIRKYSQVGDRLAVWGWRPDYYVLSNLPQAVRDGVTESSIRKGPFQQYAQTCYLNDVERNRPAIFVDGVGPGSFNFEHREQGSPAAVFPELAELLDHRYTLVADLQGSRVYVRKDRATPSHQPTAISPWTTPVALSAYAPAAVVR